MNAIPKPRYTFRPGALDAIMRSRNLTSDTQLAAVLGVRLEDVPKLRAGAAVNAAVALRVAAMQGDDKYLAAWFDLVDDRVAA